MTREHAYLRILAANAAIQQHLAVILEAKAIEMRKANEWTNRHIHASHYGEHDSLVKESIKVHEQMIEVIEGITKVETGLARNLKILLSSESKDSDADTGGSSGSGTDLSGLFDLDG